MKIFRILSLIVFIFLTACGGNSQTYNTDMSEAAAPRASGFQSKRLLIKTANLSVEVDSPKITLQKIKEFVSAEKGYVGNMHNYDQTSVRMSVRIPEKKLDLLIETVARMGEVTSKSITSRDVTENMADIEAKLTNLKALRVKFRALLKQAKNVTETLNVEKELSRIQVKIDMIESRRKRMKNQVQYSEVSIRLTKATVYGPLGYVGHGIYWFLGKLFILE